MVYSFQGHPISIKRIGDPNQQLVQPEPLVLPELLTLKQMQDIDPYEFPVPPYYTTNITLV